MPPTLDLVAVSTEMVAWCLANVPDSLEDDETATNTVRGDFHDVHLANDPGPQHPPYSSRANTHWRIPIPAPLQSLAKAQTEGDLAVFKKTQPFW